MQTEQPSEQPSKHTPPVPPSSNFALKFGALIVLGAVSANVFGFRHSRWAIGKDLHRAWQRQNPASTTSSSSTTSARAEAARRQRMDARVRAEALKRERERKMNEEVERQNIGKKKTEYTTRKHDEWENLFGRMSGFERGNSHFRVEMDARTMEELLRARGRGSGMGMDFGGGMGISEDLIRELLRAAQQGGGFAGFETEGRRSSGVNGDIGNMFGMDRHYETLGVSKNATSEEIKRAYRREVMKWHPDRYKGADKNFADARFRAATEAYDALKR